MSATESTTQLVAKSLRLTQQLEAKSQSISQLRLQLNELKTKNADVLDRSEQMEKIVADRQTEIETTIELTTKSTLFMETYALSAELEAAEIAFECLRAESATRRAMIPFQEQQLAKKRTYLMSLKKRAESMAKTEKAKRDFRERIAALIENSLQDSDQPPVEIGGNAEKTELSEEDETYKSAADHVRRMRIVSSVLRFVVLPLSFVFLFQLSFILYSCFN